MYFISNIQQICDAIFFLVFICFCPFCCQTLQPFEQILETLKKKKQGMLLSQGGLFGLVSLQKAQENQIIDIGL